MANYSITSIRTKMANVLYSVPEEFGQIKHLITRIKKGGGCYAYTIPGTRLVSIQQENDSQIDEIAHADLEQQFERSRLTIQEVEKQFKDYNEACARIFR